MKKKVISLMLAACMVMGMTACGSSASTADTQPAADGTTSDTGSYNRCSSCNNREYRR